MLGEGALVRGGGGTENFISATSYSDPQWFVYDPPLPILKADRVRWRCYYNNTENRTIGYSNADSREEMCTLAMYVAF